MKDPLCVTVSVLDLIDNHEKIIPSNDITNGVDSGCFLALNEWLTIEFLLPGDKYSDGGNRLCHVFCAEGRRLMPVDTGLLL